jgi:hypothetical protein
VQSPASYQGMVEVRRLESEDVPSGHFSERMPVSAAHTPRVG